MKDLLSLAVLALIIFSKLLGGFLILMSFLVVVLFAIESDFSISEGLKILGFGLVPTLVGGLLIKIPTLKMWPGPDVKTRDEEIS